MRMPFAAMALAAAVASPILMAAEPAVDRYAGGYLAPDALDTRQILPPAPTPGTSRYEADRTIFLATRSMQGSPRWEQATRDADEAIIVEHFGCAMEFMPDRDRLPKLYALMQRVLLDVRRAVDGPKQYYKRQRPFLVDPGPTCTPQNDALKASPDYPSGHTTWGWTVGSLLAELVPDRATPILVRARSYGDSRIVCGVHNASAVDAGRVNAASLVAALHGSAAFRADMDAVRAEIAAARTALSAPKSCAALDALIAPSPLR